MTDDPEFDLQKQVKKSPKNNNPTGKGGLKPGYDPRRWLKGRGKKSPEQREGEEILRAVIWKELNRPFDVAGLKPLDTEESVITAIELMVRTWIKKHPEQIADRIAGKVQDRLDLSNTDGTLKPEKEADDTRNEILRKLAGIATATGADKLLERPDTETT